MRLNVRDWCKRHAIVTGLVAGAIGFALMASFVSLAYTAYVDHQMIRAVYQLEWERSHPAPASK